jgi:hypothetical protein
MRGQIAVAAVILGAGVALGWKVNGWRLEARIEALRGQYAAALGQAYENARLKEQNMQVQADKLRREKDAQIDNISRRLADSLNRLRERPDRSASLPSDTGTCAGSTGAELSRPDAEFLTREAARADGAVEALNYCIAQYNAVRAQGLSPKQP